MLLFTPFPLSLFLSPPKKCENLSACYVLRVEAHLQMLHAFSSYSCARLQGYTRAATHVMVTKECRYRVKPKTYLPRYPVSDDDQYKLPKGDLLKKKTM